MNTPIMTDPIAIPTRAPAATTPDDTVLPFEVASLDLRGRVVRLGPVVDQILEKHNYPEPVAKLVGEAIVLTVMLGSALKIDGRFILQTQTDGPVGLLVVDFTTPGKVRACARFGKDGIAAAIAAGQTAPAGQCAVGMFAMAAVPLGPSTLGLMSLIVLATSVAATFLGFAVEAMIAHLTPAADRGRVSGWFQAGNLGGVGLGGADD